MKRFFFCTALLQRSLGWQTSLGLVFFGINFSNFTCQIGEVLLLCWWNTCLMCLVALEEFLFTRVTLLEKWLVSTETVITETLHENLAVWGFNDVGFYREGALKYWCNHGKHCCLTWESYCHRLMAHFHWKKLYTKDGCSWHDITAWYFWLPYFSDHKEH